MGLKRSRHSTYMTSVKENDMLESVEEYLEELELEENRDKAMAKLAVSLGITDTGFPEIDALIKKEKEKI